MKKTGLFFIGILMTVCVQGSELSPVGYWKTVDDESGKVKSIVEITKDDSGKLVGHILKIFPEPGEDPDPVCDKCSGDRFNQKIIGMNFMWDFINEKGKWVEGSILDPDNGKTYHCSLNLKNGGQELEVYGYIKIIFKIGRKQTWFRVDESALAD